MNQPIAYFISKFPSRPHTFIRREVAALREQGQSIVLFAIRKTNASELLDTHDKADAEETTALLPGSLLTFLAAHMFFLIKNPGNYFATLRAALSHRLPGIKNFIWAVLYFTAAGLLAKHLHDKDLHHIHVHFAISSANIARLSAKLANTSWSLTLHGACDFEYPNSPLLSEKIGEAKFVCCVSYYGISQAMRHVDSSQWKKLKLVRCGIDPRKLPGAKKTPNNTIKNLINVGRFSLEKGQICLLEAFAAILKTQPDLRLTLIGDGEDRAKIEATVRRLQLINQVILKGALSEYETLQEIAKSDLFLLSSFMEGIPIVLMEAMNLNVPVIAPRIAGIPELVEDKYSGLLYHPGNCQDLVEKTLCLFEDSELRDKLTRNAKLKVGNDFALPECVRPLHDFFDQR